MPVHHVALRSPDPLTLAGFYAAALDLREIRRAEDEAGVCSVWLDLGGSILMVERGAAHAQDSGWDGLFLEAEAGSGATWEARWAGMGVVATGRTDFTLYARDPEGNRLGVSSFPGGLWGS